MRQAAKYVFLTDEVLLCTPGSLQPLFTAIGKAHFQKRFMRHNNQVQRGQA